MEYEVSKKHAQLEDETRTKQDNATSESPPAYEEPQKKYSGENGEWVKSEPKTKLSKLHWGLIAGAIGVAIVVAVTVPTVLLTRRHSPCNMDCNSDNIGWGYTDSDGPECWKQCFEVCANGMEQTPILLQSDESSQGQASPPVFTGYDTPQRVRLFNTGHAAQVDISEECTVSGLDLPGTFKVAQMHWHWGRDSLRGSEHEINGRAYPMEVHIVHYNTRFNSMAEALGQPEGIAVLGWFYSAAAFRDILTKQSTPLVDNYRPVQQLHGRQVKYMHY